MALSLLCLKRGADHVDQVLQNIHMGANCDVTARADEAVLAPTLRLTWPMGFSMSLLSRADVRRVKAPSLPLAAQPLRRYQSALSNKCSWSELHHHASRGNVAKLLCSALLCAALVRGDKEEIDKKDYYGKTPLYWAAYKDQKASMQLLLNMHGAGVDLPDSWGVTPMYLAACSGQVECIQLLVQAEAKIFYKKKKTGEAPKQLSFRPTLLTWLENLVRQPHSLKHQCRQAVRRALGPARIQTLGSFALPLTLREYLMFQDLQIPNIVGQGEAGEHRVAHRGS